jgi:hypothetical protein
MSTQEQSVECVMNRRGMSPKQEVDVESRVEQLQRYRTMMEYDNSEARQVCSSSAGIYARPLIPEKTTPSPYKVPSISHKTSSQ